MLLRTFKLAQPKQENQKITLTVAPEVTVAVRQVTVQTRQQKDKICTVAVLYIVANSKNYCSGYCSNVKNLL